MSKNHDEDSSGPVDVTKEAEKDNSSADLSVARAADRGSVAGIAKVGIAKQRGKRGARRESWTRREFVIVSVIGLLLFGLVLYFGWISRGDDLKIAYIKEDFYSSSLNRDLASRQLKDSILRARLLKALRSEATREAADKCIEWLRGGDWDDACTSCAIHAVEIVRDDFGEQYAELKADIEKLERWKGSGEPVLLPLESTSHVLLSKVIPAQEVGPLETLRWTANQCEAHAESLGSLLEELSRVRQEKKKNLTGKVDLLIAILNSSDRDHIINGRAALTWGGGELEIEADRDTFIKSRSVTEIRFTIEQKNQDSKFEDWAEAVRQRSSRNYQVKILTDQGSLQEKGTLFKNGESSHHYSLE